MLYRSVERSDIFIFLGSSGEADVRAEPPAQEPDKDNPGDTL
jgi:hypothetical protein